MNARFDTLVFSIDILNRDKSGKTPLHYRKIGFCTCALIGSVVMVDNQLSLVVNILDLYFKHGADINAVTFFAEVFFVHSFLQSGFLLAVKGRRRRKYSSSRLM